MLSSSFTIRGQDATRQEVEGVLLQHKLLS